MNSTRINVDAIELLPVPEGYRISYRHITDPTLIQPSPYTGLRAKRICYAILRQVNGNDTREYRGVSRCSPKDADNKQFARVIAHNRSIKQYCKLNQVKIK